MKKSVFLIAVGVIAVLAFIAGSLVSRPGVKPTAPGGRIILYYVDPMHPAYQSDKPGIAPDCGMQLEPVYADGGSTGKVDGALPPGAVRLTPGSQQLIGVRTTVVESAPMNHQVRVLGRVTPDETRVYRILASIAGFVKSVSSVTTGAFVKRDQLLASIYSPELYALINSYIFSLNSIDRQNKLNPEDILVMRKDINIRANVNNLINIGMSKTQLDEVLRTRFNREVIDIRASEADFVLVRNISLGERFERGVEFFRIADLSKVWVMADIFENEVSYFTPGVRCTVRLPHRNLSFQARVSEVLPLYDPTSRTLKVRLETDNTGLVLRPEMFVDVELSVNLPAALTVPREALLDTGLKQIIYIDRGNGVFEPRQVEVGRYFGDRVEIIKGLMSGEKIVVSGNFLLDSESRLRNSAAGIYGTPGKDPVCGMALDEERAKAAGLTRNFAGKSWYFCGPEDMAKFDKAPKRYTGPGAMPEVMQVVPAPHAAPAVAKGVDHTNSMPMPASRHEASPLPMSMPSTGKIKTKSISQGTGGAGDASNFPTPLDDSEQMTASEPMAETPPPPAPVVAPVLPRKTIPNLSTLAMPPPKASPKAQPPAGTPRKEVPAPDSIKVPTPNAQ